MPEQPIKQISMWLPASEEMLKEAEEFKAVLHDAIQTHFEVMNAREVKSRVIT